MLCSYGIASYVFVLVNELLDGWLANLANEFEEEETNSHSSSGTGNSNKLAKLKLYIANGN